MIQFSCFLLLVAIVYTTQCTHRCLLARTTMIVQEYNDTRCFRFFCLVFASENGVVQTRRTGKRV